MLKKYRIVSSLDKGDIIRFRKFYKITIKTSYYIKITTDYITEQAQVSPKYLSDYAEIAKKTQLDTIELIMEVGKNAKNGMNKSADLKSSSPKQKSMNPHLNNFFIKILNKGGFVTFF